MSGDLGLDDDNPQMSDRIGVPEVETVGPLEMVVAKQEVQNEKSTGFMGKVSGMMGFGAKKAN